MKLHINFSETQSEDGPKTLKMSENEYQKIEKRFMFGAHSVQNV
jgi:hypothetical protein